MHRYKYSELIIIRTFKSEILEGKAYFVTEEWGRGGGGHLEFNGMLCFMFSGSTVIAEKDVLISFPKLK